MFCECAAISTYGTANTMMDMFSFGFVEYSVTVLCFYLVFHETYKYHFVKVCSTFINVNTKSFFLKLSSRKYIFAFNEYTNKCSTIFFLKKKLSILITFFSVQHSHNSIAVLVSMLKMDRGEKVARQFS